jgi:hypothetical protein
MDLSREAHACAVAGVRWLFPRDGELRESNPRPLTRKGRRERERKGRRRKRVAFPPFSLPISSIPFGARVQKRKFK